MAQRARRIAFQSVVAGIGLSVAGMIAAALGHLTSVQGALRQEAIDVAVILNAVQVLHIELHEAPGLDSVVVIPVRTKFWKGSAS